MPRPTEPVRQICYTDDITVWASGVKISELEQIVNTYLTEMSRFLWENSLLISAPKSSVTLLTPDPDTFFSFNNHCVQVANRVSKLINILKALASTNWCQQKETLLMAYKALGRSIAKYAAPVWSTNASGSNIDKI